MEGGKDDKDNDSLCTQPDDVSNPTTKQSPPKNVNIIGTPPRANPNGDDRSSPEPTPTRTPLLERLKRNKQRNEDKLNELGLAFGIKKKPRKQPKLSPNPSSASRETDTLQIESPKEKQFDVIEIIELFPHRSSQILELHCMLNDGTAPRVGPTIFVSGPRGGGKTAVVKTLIHGMIHSTYVDCTTLSINNSHSDLFRRIYLQLTGETDAPWQATQSAWNLHLALKRHTRKSFLFVLDHAERIEPATLRQLVLLPGSRFVLISRSTLLEHAAQINVTVPLVKVHFGAYRNTGTVKDILLTKRNKQSVTGVRELQGFECQVFGSFLDILIQTFHETTADIRDYIRVGRSLWPQYTAPLHPDKIESTMRNQNHSSVRDVVSLLDQTILPRLRKEVQNLGQTHTRSPRINGTIPINVHFLVLAAYICQLNHPDRDKQLFLIQKNGKRSGRKVDGAVPQLGKPRSFPAERLYSIYVSLVHLHGKGLAPGSLEFSETVKSFLSMEILRETRASFFTSSITKEEADSAAKIVKVPLQEYLS